MKKYFAAAASVIVVAGAMTVEPVRAADPFEPMPTVYDWSGPYFGVKLGYGFGDADSVPPPFVVGTTSDFDTDGFIGGIMSGYNVQSGNFVFGLDTDTSFSDINGNGRFVFPVGAASLDVDVEFLSTIRGRVGYAMDNYLPYVTGGFAYGNVDAEVGGGDEDEYHFGFTVGGGLEVAFSESWRGRVEYLYVDLGSEDHKIGGINWDVDVKEMHLIRAGLAIDTGPFWDSIFGR